MMKKIHFPFLIAASFMLLSSFSLNNKKEYVEASATSVGTEITSIVSDNFDNAGEYKNIIVNLTDTDYTNAYQLTKITSNTNGNQKIKFYDASYRQIESIENNVTYIWDNNQILFQFHYENFSLIKMVVFEAGLSMPSQQLTASGTGDYYILNQPYSFARANNRNAWFQCTEISEEIYTSISNITIGENKSGDTLTGYNICLNLNSYDHSPNSYSTKAYDYLASIAGSLSFYNENGDLMNGVSYNTELYVCSYGNHFLIQVATSNPIYKFKISNESRFPSYSMCTTGRGNYYRIKFDAYIVKKENGQYALLQSNDENIETSILAINTLTNNSITILFNETDYQYIDSSSIVGKRRNEYDYIDKTYITSNNKTYLLRNILENSQNFYYNYLGHMNSYTFSVIIDTNAITRITFKGDVSFPKHSYTGANINQELDIGDSDTKSSIIISEVSYIRCGDDFVKNQINDTAYVKEIRLGDFGDSNHFWIYLKNTDYPTSGSANIDVNSKCLALNTYDKIKVDGKSLNEYRLEGKLVEGGYINRFTRWSVFSFSISGITNSSENKAYYADKVEILKGCQFPAYSDDSYYLFDGYLKTTINTNDTFFANCSMGPVSLTAGDPNGDITDRLFIKLSEADYTKPSEITGNVATSLKNGLTLDDTSFNSGSLIKNIYKNCMGRTNTIGFAFYSSAMPDLKDADHTINVNDDTIFPAEVDSFTDYVSYHYSINRAYKFSNLNTISNRQWFDASEVELFCENYLYMSTYDTSLGYCSDNEHHYYQTAKEIYEQFDIHQKKYFEIECQDAFARFQAWAIANDDVINPVNNQVKNYLSTFNNVNFIVIIPIVIVFLVGASLCICIRKNKNKSDQ